MIELTKLHYSMGDLQKALKNAGIKTTTAMLRHYEEVFEMTFPFNPIRTRAGQRQYSKSQMQGIYELLRINASFKNTVITIEGLRAISRGHLTVDYNKKDLT